MSPGASEGIEKIDESVDVRGISDQNSETDVVRKPEPAMNFSTVKHPTLLAGASLWTQLKNSNEVSKTYPLAKAHPGVTYTCPDQ